MATAGGREYRDGLQVVEYEHVERRQLVRPAEARVLALDVRTAPGAAVGYVMGSGDAVADAIERLGVPLTRLTADDLAFGDLARFTTIVTGIRAYDTRADLRSAQSRLMAWVTKGGHLVVQYNREPFNRLPGGRAGSGRLEPVHAVSRAGHGGAHQRRERPAARARASCTRCSACRTGIGAGDWAGWVQERGIQLLAARDARYTELLAATDPFPYNPGEKRGMLVDATVGRGTWTYVGLALFRQVPAAVPGGWRLLANLISRPRPPVPAATAQRAALSARESDGRHHVAGALAVLEAQRGGGHAGGARVPSAPAAPGTRPVRRPARRRAAPAARARGTRQLQPPSTGSSSRLRSSHRPPWRTTNASGTSKQPYAAIGERPGRGRAKPSASASQAKSATASATQPRGSAAGATVTPSSSSTKPDRCGE